MTAFLNKSFRYKVISNIKLIASFANYFFIISAIYSTNLVCSINRTLEFSPIAK